MIIKKITIEATKGRAAALEEMLTSLVAPSRDEDGCCRYDVFNIEGKPGHFLLIEAWESDAHLDKHKATAHFLRFKDAADTLVAGKSSESLRELS